MLRRLAFCTKRYHLCTPSCVLTCMTVLGLLTTTGADPSPASVQFLDAQTGAPLVGVNYTYGDHHGVADTAGSILLTHRAGTRLILSHVAYGRHSLDGDAVLLAVENGVLHLFTTPQAMHPVSVVGTRPLDGALTIDMQDRVEHDAGAFLDRTPGLSAVRKSGSYGFDPVLRGFKHDQIHLLIDGALTAKAACPNRMDPPSSQVAMNGVERVEVHKGPHSFRYGNAFAGTVNFASPSPRYSDIMRRVGRASSSYSSNGEQARTEALLGLRGPSYDVALLGSWSRGVDYTGGDDVELPAEFTRGSFALRTVLRVAEDRDLVVSATRNVARDVDFPALPMDLRDDDTWLLNLRYEDRGSGDSRVIAWRTNLHASRVDHRMDNHLRPPDTRMVDTATEAQTASWGLRTEAKLGREPHRIYVGADVLVERAEGTRQRTFLRGAKAGVTIHDNVWQDASILKPGLFGEWHTITGSTRWIVSGRAEIDHADATDPAAEYAAAPSNMEATQVNPGLSFGVRRPLSRAVSVGLWLGRTQRSGGLTERYINGFPVGLDRYEMLGNPNLDPEVNNQLDVILTWTPAPTTRVGFEGFASYLQDLISSRVLPDQAPRLPSAAGVRQYRNIRDARILGFEVRWDQALHLGWRHEMTAAFSRGQDLVRDEPLPEIPPFDLRYRLLGSYREDRLRPELNLRHADEQKHVSTSFGEQPTPGFQVVDARVTWDLDLHWILTMGVENLLDETYYEHLTRATRDAQGHPIYSTGRNLTLMLTSRWL